MGNKQYYFISIEVVEEMVDEVRKERGWNIEEKETWEEGANRRGERRVRKGVREEGELEGGEDCVNNSVSTAARLKTVLIENNSWTFLLNYFEKVRIYFKIRQSSV